MSGRVVTVSMVNDYPFGVSQDYSQPRTTVQVKKSVDFSSEPRFVMKEKLRMLKSLGVPQLIGLLSTTQEESMLHLYFQYVPKKMEALLWSLEGEVVERVKGEMLQLAQYLANHSIVLDLRIENVGLDKSNHLKYFMGFGFRIDRALNRPLTVERYQQTVKSFFAEGGRFSRVQSPFKPAKQEYCQTMDTTSDNHNYKLQGTRNGSRIGGHISMKKSATVSGNPSEKLQEQLEARLSLMEGQKQTVLVQQHVEESGTFRNTRNELKAVKIEQLGARINKLKHYMKQVTGKTPTNSGGMSHMIVKYDDRNCENRICTQNKLMITPNYTKLQKKIAQFRQSKLYRTYGERQILFSKNNHGYQLQTTEKVQRNSPTTSPRQSNDIRAIDIMKQTEPHLSSNQKVLKDQRNDKDGLNKSNHSINSSKNIGKEDDPNQKEYRKLGKVDKYCEQFMYFLDDSPIDQNPGQISPSLVTLLNQMNTQEICFRPREESVHMQTEGSGISPSTVEIQNRVKKAIRNSIKIMHGLKYRDIQLPLQ